MDNNGSLWWQGSGNEEGQGWRGKRNKVKEKKEPVDKMEATSFPPFLSFSLVSPLPHLINNAECGAPRCCEVFVNGHANCNKQKWCLSPPTGTTLLIRLARLDGILGEEKKYEGDKGRGWRRGEGAKNGGQSEREKEMESGAIERALFRDTCRQEGDEEEKRYTEKTKMKKRRGRGQCWGWERRIKGEDEEEDRGKEIMSNRKQTKWRRGKGRVEGDPRKGQIISDQRSDCEQNKSRKRRSRWRRWCHHLFITNDQPHCYRKC